MLRYCGLFVIFFFQNLIITAQENLRSFTDDSTHPTHKYLPDVTVVGRHSKSDIQQMPEVVGTSIYAGKKNALIVLDNVKGNVVTNNMRQIMAKIPGIHVWENDGSGIQIGIAARGLSPNRSWEFNVRQNGYDISADPFGYPEAYYNPQLQAVQRIEVVRGQGALQYGPQFGGLVNYILRNGSEINKTFEFETQQTISSNNLFNSYNAIGGETKKIHYYSFFDHRNSDGWRQNSQYFTNAGFGTITYRPTEKFTITAELMNSHIRSQQPGGLTDNELNQQPSQSFRHRNWFDIKWVTAALIANYQFSEKKLLQVKLFNVMGDRNSVGYFPSGGITIADTINRTTNQFNARNLNTDLYRNFGGEARYLETYNFLKSRNTISIGARVYQGNTFRYAADGKGSTGIDYDMTLAEGICTKDIDFGTFNTAFFAENIFHIGKKLIIIPGIRYEFITGKASGRNGFNGTAELLLQNQKKSRYFILKGIGAEYHVTPATEFYANITESYRPVQFADLTAPPTTDIIDEQLDDAKGFNADFGYRGKVKDYLFFDISSFFLQYNNRIGVIVKQRTDGSFYNFRTNVGNSSSKGIEALIDFSPTKMFSTIESDFDLNMFASYGYTNARYTNLKVITKNSSNQLVETNLKNKKVENAPENILRGGATIRYKDFSLTSQFSWVDESYADANNTITPTMNGQNGLIPYYLVSDITLAYKFSKSLNWKAGINNLTNEKYFTRRASGYPGPGAMPADGRTFFMSLGIKM